MKKMLFSISMTLTLTSCAQLDTFVKEVQEAAKQERIAQQKSAVKNKKAAVDANQHVIRVKQRPNKGKKVVKDGIVYDENFSLDKNGNLEFNPVISDRAIRDWNRITQQMGVTIQGY